MSPGLQLKWDLEEDEVLNAFKRNLRTEFYQHPLIRECNLFMHSQKTGPNPVLCIQPELSRKGSPLGNLL